MREDKIHAAQKLISRLKTVEDEENYIERHPDIDKILDRLLLEVESPANIMLDRKS